MQNLIQQVNNIPDGVKKVIDQRLAEFSSFKDKNTEEWFSELCFCILTANSRALSALAIQRKLGFNGFYSLSQEDLVKEIVNHKHRFHNTKAKRIVEARKHRNVKKIITDIVAQDGTFAAREWLVENVKGLGYKESSHFLRNVGYSDLAIVDRHILGILHDEKLLDKIPSSVTPKNYAQIESLLEELGKRINMSQDRLDLSLWYLRTGKVLK